jgi:hypothetical protein
VVGSQPASAKADKQGTCFHRPKNQPNPTQNCLAVFAFCSMIVLLHADHSGFSAWRSTAATFVLILYPPPQTLRHQPSPKLLLFFFSCSMIVLLHAYHLGFSA